MRRTWTRRRLVGASVVLLAAMLAAPAIAGEMLTSGADLWQTATGLSFTSFREEPIPAGFFCESSPAFTGVIQLNGKPLVTEPAGALGNVDTIVRRLDDAVLNAKGEASTRIQLLALSLASVKPVDTGCGLYDVSASLAGEQPLTTMRILRTSSGGGTYVAPLSLNVKLTFTPVAGNIRGERRELTHPINLGPGSQSVWSYSKPVYAEQRPVRVDTDGDGVADTLVPGPSNFRAGVAPAMAQTCGGTPTTSCHCSLTSTDPSQSAAGCDHLHCVTITSGNCLQPQRTLPTN